MFEELNNYKNKILKDKIGSYRNKGVLISKKAEEDILNTPIIEKTDLGPKVFVLPDKSFSPSEYLVMLKEELKQDVFPLIKTEGRAPFNVLRSTFCYLDHVAKLRYGRSGSGSMGNLQKLFSDFGAYTYIKTLYSKYFQDLIQLYRHDLVHSTRPLPNVRRVDRSSDEQVVYWITNVSLPEDIEKLINSSQNIKEVFEEICVKMRNDKTRKNLFHLRLNGTRYELWMNVWCFFFDSIIYLEDYSKLLLGHEGEVKFFLKNYIENFIESMFKQINNPPMSTVNNKAVI